MNGKHLYFCLVTACHHDVDSCARRSAQRGHSGVSIRLRLRYVHLNCASPSHRYWDVTGSCSMRSAATATPLRRCQTPMTSSGPDGMQRFRISEQLCRGGRLWLKTESSQSFCRLWVLLFWESEPGFCAFIKYLNDLKQCADCFPACSAEWITPN